MQSFMSKRNKYFASISQASQYLLVERNFVREHKGFANKRKVSQWNTKSLVSEYKLSEGTQKFCEQMQSLSRSAKVFRVNTKFLRERKSFVNKYKVC